MVSVGRYNWRIAAVCTVCLSGCMGLHRAPYAGDPLLASKRPAPGKAGKEETPLLLAYAEPRPPQLPTEALVSRPSAAPIERPSAKRALAQLPGNSGKAVEPRAMAPVQATPIETRKEKVRLEAFVAGRRMVPGIYGHASDYSWLQGILDRPGSARSELLYGSPGEEDAWGGRVRLEPDPRLADFEAGDVIIVEGELVLDQTPRSSSTSSIPPSYRIRQVWLVRPHG